jgi:SsrA-binding protein
MAKATRSPRIVNRKARHDYHIVESLEVGIQLRGSEVKSARDSRVSIAEGFAYVDPKRMELWLYDVDIAAYPNAPVDAHEPKRPRKLLAHRKQIERLYGLTTASGTTLVPLTMYFNDRGIAKVELGVATGKGKADKRERYKKSEHVREMRRAMTRKRLG